MHCFPWDQGVEIVVSHQISIAIYSDRVDRVIRISLVGFLIEVVGKAPLKLHRKGDSIK